MKIIVLATSTSTIVIPILTLQDVELDTELTELDNSKLEFVGTLANVFNNPDGVISITSGMADQDNVIKPIIIPNHYEGADNKTSISNVLEFFKLNATEIITLEIEDLEFGDFDLFGKVIKLKNNS